MIAKYAKIQENVLLSSYCSFGVGGVARFFLEIESIDDLVLARIFAVDFGLPVWFFGQGTNILFPDVGLDGLVLRNKMKGVDINGEDILCSSGELWGNVLAIVEGYDFSGFESFSGLPGTVGGAVYGNAGCFGLEMSNLVKFVYVYDFRCGEEKIFAKDDIDWLYRRTSLCDNSYLYITSVVMNMPSIDVSAVENVMNNTASTHTNIDNINISTDISRKSIAISRVSKHPSGRSTGSFFRNPDGDMSAGQMIDLAGLKGRSVGGAMVSLKHGNFFINIGDACAGDFLLLRDMVVDTVYEKYNIKLESEVRVISGDEGLILAVG